MKLQVGTIRSNRNGFSRIAGLSEDSRGLWLESAELDFGQCSFFEANMAAPLYVVIAKLRDELNDVTIDNVPAATEKILKKNEFLTVFNMEVLRDTNQTTLPFKIFKLQAGEQFNDYLDTYMKMNNKAYDLASYSFSQGEQILVDSNIWLYLFPAPRNPHQRFAQQYSSAFSRLVGAQAQPVLDAMVLSEYLMHVILFPCYLDSVLKKAWQERDHSFIVAIADRIPNNVLEEDPNLLMWYDQAVTRMEGE